MTACSAGTTAGAWTRLLAKMNNHSDEAFDCWISICWAEARIKIARIILTIRLDWNWSSFQLANIALPVDVMSCDIAPSARIHVECMVTERLALCPGRRCVSAAINVGTDTRSSWFSCARHNEVEPQIQSYCWVQDAPSKIDQSPLMRSFHGNL